MLNDIIECARLAGNTALKFFRHRNLMDVDNKFNDSDIVTTADRSTEEIIKNFIALRYPTHSILSEETGVKDGESEYRWVVDPIDGTTNFYAGIPFWGISIAVEHNGVTQYGVVYLPALGELFCAEKGCGAFLNCMKIKVADETNLAKSVISTGFPVDKNVNDDNNLSNFAAVLPKVRDMRRLGSASADICYTAAGFLNGFWELGLHEWDVKAGLLILEEAGGTWSHFRHDRGVAVVCGNQSIHNQLKELIR